MALVNGTTQLGFKFITTASWNARATGNNSAALTAEELASGDIIFIEATNQIFAGGAYFGVTPSQAQNLTTLWNDIETAETGLKAKVGALEEKVGTSAKLSQTLLAIANDLKSKLDGGSYTGEGTAGTAITVTKTVEGQQVAISNVTEAVNELFTRITSMVAGVASVNGKTGTVTLTGADIAVSTTNSDKIDVALGKKVDLSTDTTVGANTGKKASDYTNTKVIGDAIEAAHKAGADAQTEAEGKIAKSSTDTTAKTISGVKGSDLTTGAAIATAIETACDRLLKDASNQAQTNWASGEKKTLTTLRNLIHDLDQTISTLTSGDLATIQNSITAIKNELGGTETDNPTRNLVGSLLDAVATVLPTKNANNTYTFNIGTGTGATTTTTIQGAIDALITRIENAAGAGVTKITQGDGITVNNGGVGNVTVNATSGAKTTAALTKKSGSSHGATTAKASTIQTALQDINNELGDAYDRADTAVTAAGNAQTSANNALNQLKWVVV